MSTLANAGRWSRRFLPSPSDYAGLRQTWRADVLAGVTVGVVALPLALGFGVTTGLGASAGLVTAIVAGLVAAVFGGSAVQVSGPTGAMTVVLVPLVERYGSNAVLVVGMMAGVLIVVAAFGRVGRYLAYVPWPVVEGFTVGIAVIIFLQQVPAALGVPKPDGENTAVVALRAVVDWAGAPSAAAVGIVALVAVVMVGAPRLHRSLPASLLAVAVAAVVASVADLDVVRIGKLPTALPAPSWPTFDWDQMSRLGSAAFAVAALGALESLLSAKVADGMTSSRHDPDRELFGQGLANLVSPLFGGMPATGAIARTAVNVRGGARTRLASITHALVLIAVVYAAGPLVAEIPLAALAGVLMVTAARMVERHNVASVWRSTRADAAVFALTAATTIVFDLVVAVEVGVAVAAAMALRLVARAATVRAEPVDVLPPMFTRPHFDSAGDDEGTAPTDTRIVTYRLEGACFFGAAQRFLTEVTAVSDVDVVILRLPGLDVLDATGAHTLGEIVRELQDRGITVLIKGARPEHVGILRAVGALDELTGDDHLFDHLDDAVAHARRHVRRGRRAAVANDGPPDAAPPRRRGRRPSRVTGEPTKGAQP